MPSVPPIPVELWSQISPAAQAAFLALVQQYEERFAGTSATPEQLAEVLRINAEARIRALKAAFLVLSGLALLAIFPCRWLPTYMPGEIPSDQPPSKAEHG